MSSLRAIKGDSEKFGDALRVLTKHINDAKNTSDIVNTRYSSLNTKIEGAGGLKSGEKKLLEQESTVPEETEETIEE